jgi:peptide/nickel transport system substrate-binding protein
MMNLRKIRKLTAIVLAFSFALLTGCASQSADQTNGSDYVQGTIAGTERAHPMPRRRLFPEFCAADGFNPYTTQNSDNQLVDQLVYENIFEVDNNFNLSSRIVTNWQSVDGVYWYFTIDTGIVMSDGEHLTAKDVSYSLQQAMRSSRYAGRFSYVWGVSASSDDTFAVTLSAADEQFPYLLTVPVIKYGGVGEDTPAGTGPYQFSEDKTSLVVSENYPDWQNLPVDTVGLKEYDSIEDTITAFEDSYIDLVVNDPSGITDLGYGGNNETRYYTTNNMHYLGFNMKSDDPTSFLRYSSYRYALQYAVDREYAADTYMNGAAVASTLPINPNSPLYDADYAANFNYDLDRCKLILNNAGAQDYDGDGKLEYMVTGIPMEISLDLIVCSEASGKADIAKKFAADLATIGVTVNVRELSWDDYIAALQSGDFDIYYGEVKLTADFSLTRLLDVDGDLNYCGIDDETYGDYIAQYLAAGDDMRQTCCDILLKYINDTAPIIPICFERQEVITHRNVASGLAPSQYDIFYNIGSWKINFN